MASQDEKLAKFKREYKEKNRVEELERCWGKKILSIDLIKLSYSLNGKIAIDLARSRCEKLVAEKKVTAQSIEAAMVLWSVTQEEEDFERVEKMMVAGKTELNEKCLVEALGKTLYLSPLHTAVYLKSPQLVELFMRFDGVDVCLQYNNPEAVDDFGNVLDLAISLENNLDVIKSVLENDKERKLVNPRGGIPIRFLINEVEVVELLLNYEDAYPSLNPLSFLAISMRNDQLNMFMKILPQAKPRLNTTVPNLPCPFCSSSTVTLLHLAICLNNPKMVKILLQAGSDVNSSEGQHGGISPLMQGLVTARHRGHCGKGKCQDRVISELLSAEGINLDIQMGEKTTALDLINICTCPSTKQMVEQAYTRHSLRKEMMKRREDQGKDEPAKGDKAKGDKAKAEEVKADQTNDDPTNDDPSKVDQAESDQVKVSKHKREKICWNCRSPPTSKKLYRCAGCHVAWYCGGITCQKEDWSRHSGWCVLKEQRRKEKEAQK
eukprot:GFUD01047813.1.p1 GENE.GFUD01047813.1~~GFUD01047813.1.p1  ORF type:complete len:507 (+),score=132.29 GFUD01047813.1:44-1522(+)